jgi:hypothetical protein
MTELSLLIQIRGAENTRFLIYDEDFLREVQAHTAKLVAFHTAGPEPAVKVNRLVPVNELGAELVDQLLGEAGK